MDNREVQVLVTVRAHSEDVGAKELLEALREAKSENDNHLGVGGYLEFDIVKLQIVEN